MAGNRAPIEVTQEVIDGAVRRDSSHCVVADAIRAQVPGAEKVSVDLQTIRWTDTKRGRRYTFLTPPICQVVLLKFDQGELIEPFSFRVRNPVHVLTTATKKQNRRVAPGKNGEQGELLPSTKSTREYKARSLRSNGPGHVPTVVDGEPPRFNGALAFGAGAGKGRVRVFGLKQLVS